MSASTPTSTVTPRARNRAMPAPRDVGIRVFDGDDHASHAGVDQRIRARRRAAFVRAGLEGDVGGGAACPLPRRPQRVGLGMRTTGRLGRALPDRRAVADEQAADPRIGRRVTTGDRGQGESPPHELGVGVHAVPPPCGVFRSNVVH